MSANSAANPTADQATAKSKDKLIQLNEDLIDNCSTASSSSGSDKLRIDIPEEAKEEPKTKQSTTANAVEQQNSKEIKKVRLILLFIVIEQYVRILISRDSYDCKVRLRDLNLMN